MARSTLSQMQILDLSTLPLLALERLVIRRHAPRVELQELALMLGSSEGKVT